MLFAVIRGVPLVAASSGERLQEVNVDSEFVQTPNTSQTFHFLVFTFVNESLYTHLSSHILLSIQIHSLRSLCIRSVLPKVFDASVAIGETVSALARRIRY